MLRPIALAAILALQPVSAGAQGISDQERMDNICNLNPNSALCTARAQGKIKSEGLDLAQAVKKGEQSTTSAVTTGEMAQCWATWVAIRERIAAKGRETWPADYTLKALDKRIADWRKAMLRSTDGDAEAMARYADPELETARADVAGPKIIVAAQTSGACKVLPQ
jgi:hypothetical protein